MTKQYIALVVAAGLALSVAACGGDDDDADAGAAPTEGGAETGVVPTVGVVPTIAPTDLTSPGGSSPAAAGPATVAPADESLAGTGDGKTFTFVLPGDPQNLDPHGPTSAVRVALQVKRFLYDPLVNLSTEDANPRPGLAESWEETDAGLVLTLHDGVTCSDGTPLTATTVADNINWVADPANASAMLGVVIPPGTSATADDAANTVTLAASIAPRFMLRQLSEFSIACAAGLADHASMEMASNGTGPYVLDEMVPGSEIRMTRRDGYDWGPVAVAEGQLPETVVIRIVQNETTAANLLVSGEVNAAAIRGGDQQRLRDEGMPYMAFRVPVGQVTFNQREGHPTADQAVRTALVAAIDRAQASSIATDGAGFPTAGNAVLPYLCGGVDPESVLPAYDPAAAEATLTEAGWTRDGGSWSKDGEELGGLVITYPAEVGPAVASAVEFLGQQLAEAGVSNELLAVTPTQWLDIRTTGAWDIAWNVFEADTPTHMVGLFTGKLPEDGGRDWSAIVNPKFVDIEADLSEPSCDVWNDAEMWNYESASQIPLDNIEVPYFATGAEFRVGGIGGQIHPTTITMVEG